MLYENSSFVICLFGPTGSGKTHWKNYLCSKGFKNIKSYTTRKKRNENDKEYCFVRKEIFKEIFKRGFFINVNNYCNEYYAVIKMDFLKCHIGLTQKILVDDDIEKSIFEFIKNRSLEKESTASRHIHRRFGISMDDAEKLLVTFAKKNLVKQFYDDEYQENRYTIVEN